MARRPLPILEEVGKLAYELDIPSTLSIHPGIFLDRYLFSSEYGYAVPYNYNTTHVSLAQVTETERSLAQKLREDNLAPRLTR